MKKHSKEEEQTSNRRGRQYKKEKNLQRNMINNLIPIKPMIDQPRYYCYK